ncbi:MAG: NTP transferase domain-containing protein, partial [Acidobacteriota bacterium]|nr:NTP transferase domain-containing protein [Acidobacteriota bacterium]
ILVVTSAARAGEFGPERLATARLVIDHYPAAGPLGALLTALESVTPMPAALLVLAADMPGVSRKLVDALMTLHDGGAGCDATVPQSAHGLEPLAAVYAASAAAGLRRVFESGERSLQRALAALRVRVMPLEAVSALGDPVLLFRNINRPEDLLQGQA